MYQKERVVSAAQVFLAYGVNMITRRAFFRFFLIGGILSLFSKKVKAEQPLKKAMFWRRIE